MKVVALPEGKLFDETVLSDHFCRAARNRDRESSRTFGAERTVLVFACRAL
jgi:hypothetical protein